MGRWSDCAESDGVRYWRPNDVSWWSIEEIKNPALHLQGFWVIIRSYLGRDLGNSYPAAGMAAGLLLQA